MIYIPKPIIEPKDPITATVCPKGKYQLRAIRSDGRVRRESPWFDNLILDSGLDRIGEASTTHSHCAVGTGATAAVAANTQLESFLASTTNIQSAVNATSPSSPYFARKTWTYRFGQGVAAGNLTEVGVGWADTSMFSRALIEDAGGSPTTFTVLADEFLEVAYQLTCFVPLADVIDTVDISGAIHDIVFRAANAATVWNLHHGSLSKSGSFGGGGYTTFGGGHRVYDGDIGSITGEPSGSNGASSSAANNAYVAGSFQREYSVTFGLDDGNLASGIKSILTGMGGRNGNTDDAIMRFQCSFTPVIAKDATKILTLNFRHQWARA